MATSSFDVPKFVCAPEYVGSFFEALDEWVEELEEEQREVTEKINKVHGRIKKLRKEW